MCHLYICFLRTRLYWECICFIVHVFSSLQPMLENHIDRNNCLSAEYWEQGEQKIISTARSNFCLLVYLFLFRDDWKKRKFTPELCYWIKRKFLKKISADLIQLLLLRKEINCFFGAGLFKSYHWWRELASLLFYTYCFVLNFTVWLGNSLQFFLTEPSDQSTYQLVVKSVSLQKISKCIFIWLLSPSFASIKYFQYLLLSLSIWILRGKE